MIYRIEEKGNDEIVVSLSGSLMGPETTGELENGLKEAMDRGKKTVTLNLSDVAAINSSGIGKILLYEKKLKSDREGKLRIKGCSKNLFKTFQLIKVDVLIDIEP